ncbi:T9SS type A sorting domain-containing protein, partial [candidate division KSB1 bacterium]|nr:T9SS type A sorting domain-containing protein [candidate division KSB1 bacterium]
EKLAGGQDLFYLFFQPHRSYTEDGFRIATARFNEGQTPVRINNDERNTGVKTFRVLENYPNPFNASTNFWMMLPEGDSNQLTVEILNLLGQKVRTLFNGRLEGGYHRLTWDGRNDFFHPVPSGMYICRFNYGSRQELRKVLLVR